MSSFRDKLSGNYRNTRVRIAFRPHSAPKRSCRHYSCEVYNHRHMLGLLYLTPRIRRPVFFPFIRDKRACNARACVRPRATALHITALNNASERAKILETRLRHPRTATDYNYSSVRDTPGSNAPLLSRISRTQERSCNRTHACVHAYRPAAPARYNTPTASRHRLSRERRDLRNAFLRRL